MNGFDAPQVNAKANRQDAFNALMVAKTWLNKPTIKCPSHSSSL